MTESRGEFKNPSTGHKTSIVRGNVELKCRPVFCFPGLLFGSLILPTVFLWLLLERSCKNKFQTTFYLQNPHSSTSLCPRWSRTRIVLWKSSSHSFHLIHLDEKCGQHSLFTVRIETTTTENGSKISKYKNLIYIHIYIFLVPKRRFWSDGKDITWTFITHGLLFYIRIRY